MAAATYKIPTKIILFEIGIMEPWAMYLTNSKNYTPKASLTKNRLRFIMIFLYAIKTQNVP